MMKSYHSLALATFLLLSGCASDNGWRQYFKPAQCAIKPAPAISPDIVHGEEVYFKNEEDFRRNVQVKFYKPIIVSDNLVLGNIIQGGKLLNPGQLRWITATMGGDFYYYNACPSSKDPAISSYAIVICATPSRQVELKKSGVLNITLQEARQRTSGSQQHSQAGELLLNGSTL